MSRRLDQLQLQQLQLLRSLPDAHTSPGSLLAEMADTAGPLVKQILPGQERLPLPSH